MCCFCILCADGDSPGILLTTVIPLSIVSVAGRTCVVIVIVIIIVVVAAAAVVVPAGVLLLLLLLLFRRLHLLPSHPLLFANTVCIYNIV